MNFSKEELQELIIENFFGYCTVIDNKGKILYIHNGRNIGLPEADYLGSNLEKWVKNGYFTNSPTLKALHTGNVEVDWIGGKVTHKLVTISKPVFDENGKVKVVIGYSQNQEQLHDFIKKMEEEHTKASETIQYLINDKRYNNPVIAESKAIQKICSLLRKAANSESSIILYGESGTGKEVMARYIHDNSTRHNEIFVPINCAAIPAELLEMEFFGYEKGSFTGAEKNGKIGLFELATNGTLFLDEIGELPLSLQAKLLRVIESGEVKRIGGNKIIKTTARIVCATNRDLKKMVRDGSFREDLFYRLDVISVVIPPIRERPEDILPLAYRFLEEYNKKYSQTKTFSPCVLKQLLAYDWPGNVREIRNVVERMYIISSSDILSLENNLAPSASDIKKQATVSEDINPKDCLKNAVYEYEKRYILSAINSCKGNITLAAKKLQISRAALYKKLDSYKNPLLKD